MKAVILAFLALIVTTTAGRVEYVIVEEYVKRIWCDGPTEYLPKILPFKPEESPPPCGSIVQCVDVDRCNREQGRRRLAQWCKCGGRVGTTMCHDECEFCCQDYEDWLDGL